MPRHPSGVGAVLIALSAALLFAQSADRVAPREASATSSTDAPESVRPFLERYCISCHSSGPGEEGREPSGDFDLAPWVEQVATHWDEIDAFEVRDRVRYFEMPPRGERQPTETEREAFLAALDAWLGPDPLAAEVDPGPITVRRLNRTEYENTVRDWLGVDFDAAALFPADDVGDGFDNNADVLSLSPMLLEKYLQAAETIAARAVFDRARDGRGASIVVDAGEFDRQRSGRPRDGVLWLSSTEEVSKRVSIDQAGRYRWILTATGQQAGPEPVRCEFRRDGRRLGEVKVPVQVPKQGTYEFFAELSAGTQRVGVAFINDYYRPEHPDPKQRDRNCGIVSLRLEGPLDPAELPRFQRERFPEIVPMADSWSRWEVLAPTLMAEATRRPVDAEALGELRAVVADISPEEPNLEELMRSTLIALLVSPRFIFRLELDPPGTPGPTRDLDDHELAVRLSYFIWSTLPDAELRRLADEGRLTEPEVWQGQVTRMLRDARSLALAENFATQWLQIRDLLERRPDPRRFPRVDDALLADMRMETVLLFDAVLREKRPVWELLEAEFTFVNEALAEHYGIPGVRGDHLRRVRVASPERRGLLGQGSVLLATSNPTRTSPVKRGKWILEAILDSPPPPAPPGVDGLVTEGDEAGEKTLRELLVAHRADPDCSGCHARMDALGFGLENFDAVGRWRTLEGDRPVDATGELPDGRVFSGPRELRGVLRSDPSFLRSLSKQMLTFALGRGTVDGDRPLIERCVKQLQEEPTFERLILEITRSEPFRRKRVEP